MLGKHKNTFPTKKDKMNQYQKEYKLSNIYSSDKYFTTLEYISESGKVYKNVYAVSSEPWDLDSVEKFDLKLIGTDIVTYHSGRAFNRKTDREMFVFNTFPSPYSDSDGWVHVDAVDSAFDAFDDSDAASDAASDDSDAADTDVSAYEKRRIYQRKGFPTTLKYRSPSGMLYTNVYGVTCDPWDPNAANLLGLEFVAEDLVKYHSGSSRSTARLGLRVPQFPIISCH